MRGLYAIYRKEMGHYLVSPIAYVVVGVFLLLAGFFFSRILEFVIQSAMASAMQSMRSGRASDIDVPSVVLRDFFGVMSTLLLFIIPLLTMGVYAEERKRGTMELLMTSPVTDAQIVLGKFFGSVTLLVMMLLPTAGYQIYMFAHSEPRPPWNVLAAGYLGMLLLGAVLLAIGSFLSSVTENQLIASVLTFGTFLLLWVIDLGQRGASGTLASVLQYFSIVQHYDDFTHGVIDTTSLVFYGSLIVLGIYLTMRSIDSMRWRRA